MGASWKIGTTMMARVSATSGVMRTSEREEGDEDEDEAREKQ